jgi:hypothetical protein
MENKQILEPEKEKTKINCLLCFGFILQVTAGEEKKRGRSRSRLPLLLGFFFSWRRRVGRRAATVPAPRNPAEHCSGLQNCSLKIPDCFGVVIVILMYIFVYLF